MLCYETTRKTSGKALFRTENRCGSKSQLLLSQLLRSWGLTPSTDQRTSRSAVVLAFINSSGWFSSLPCSLTLPWFVVPFGQSNQMRRFKVKRKKAGFSSKVAPKMAFLKYRTFGAFQRYFGAIFALKKVHPFKAKGHLCWFSFWSRFSFLLCEKFAG